MEIPEHLHELVDQLGQALVQALAMDPTSRTLAREIQGEGFEVTLLLEATVALHKRGDEGETEMMVGLENLDLDSNPSSREGHSAAEPGGAGSPWSEEDRAFLRTFKISLD